MTDEERIAILESDREILLNGYKIIFQTGDYDKLCEMQDAMQKISHMYPTEPEPKRIVQVLRLVKGFFRES
jgi:hypothetical protein